jgi:lipopolysaccharide export system protein LptA
MGAAASRQEKAAVLFALGFALFFFSNFAFAQSQVGGFGALSGANSKKPIDIESDRLEVDDKKHIAIFTGSVSATQGDYNLTAPRLDVFYENKDSTSPQPQTSAPGKPPVNKASQQVAPSDPISNGQIDHIHAYGGTVVVKSAKDEQQATGEDAYYDVKAQKITMTGKKVVLTQKKNIVEGKKLIVDLNTSQATVIPDGELAKGQPQGSAPKGRVRAILNQEGAAALTNPLTGGVVKKKEDPPKPAPAAPKQPQPPASWQPQSQ